MALLLLQSFLVPAQGVAAQQADPGQVAITGTVVNAVTQEPIPGVTVVLGGLGFRFLTNAAGQFTVARIALGTYAMQLSHPDYNPSVGDFTVMREGEFVTAMEPVPFRGDELMTGIMGVVSAGNGGGPLTGASVRSGASRLGTLTDARGRFSFERVAVGQHVIEFSHLGYATRADTIRVMPERITNVRVSLSVDPVQLDPIEVRVERREVALQDVGFYNRKSVGFGKFIDREEIEMRAPAEFTDLFSGIPGVELYPDPSNPLQKYVVLRGGRQGSFSAGDYGRCFPRVYLDGIVMHQGGDEPAQLDNFLSSVAVAGVEVFPTSAGVPARFGGVGSSCGTILIWTRR